jgi:hypothetical protein
MSEEKLEERKKLIKEISDDLDKIMEIEREIEIKLMKIGHPWRVEDAKQIRHYAQRLKWDMGSTLWLTDYLIELSKKK